MIVEASPIWNDRLYMGSFPLVGSNLCADGFHLLVLCAVERLYMLGNPSERETSEMFQCQTLHAPFDDGSVNDEVVLAARHAARNTVAALQRGEKVLVTCNAGRNRSGLVVALALLATFPAMTPQSVVKLIKKRRVTPGGEKALTNDEFVDFIKLWRR